MPGPLIGDGDVCVPVAAELNRYRDFSGTVITCVGHQFHDDVRERAAVLLAGAEVISSCRYGRPGHADGLIGQPYRRRWIAYWAASVVMSSLWPVTRTSSSIVWIAEPVDSGAGLVAYRAVCGYVGSQHSNRKLADLAADIVSPGLCQ